MMNNRSSVRRRFFVGGVLLALGSTLALGGGGCESLPEVQINQCGNYVIEPDNFEDCDGDVSDSRLCGLKSTPGACRWLCDYPSGVIKCPPEWGCGLDGICRKSTGLSDAPISIAGAGTVRLFRGDFDGDGRDDIASSGLNSIDVFFLTTEGFVERSVALPNGKGLPSVGDVNDDGKSDIAIAYERSVGVLLGQESRSFIANSRPMLETLAETTELLPLDQYLKSNTILAIGSNALDQPTVDGIELQNDGSYVHLNLPMIGGLPGKPAGKLALASTNVNGGQCAHIALEINAKMASRLAILKYCESTGLDTMPELVENLDGDAWSGAYFADADGSGTVDLFFGFVKNGTQQLQVILDVLEGMPSQAMDVISEGDSPCVPDKPELAGPPLAIGDVNGDKYADIVDSRGVLLYDLSQPPNQTPPKFIRKCLILKELDPSAPNADNINWEHAIINDFDGDGVNDVLASRQFANQDPSQRRGTLDLWMWHPEGLITVPIVISAPVEGFVGGDMNGDSITDAAFWINPPPPMPNEPKLPASLYVMFGNPQALPSPPQLIGRVNDIQNLAMGRVLGTNTAMERDNLADLLVLGATSPGTMDKPITIIQGNTTRYPVAPLPIRDGAAGQGNGSGDPIYQVYVSDFGAEYCPPPTTPAMPSPDDEPFHVLALGGNSIWRSGCFSNGSSFALDKGLDLHDHTCLFAPIDKVSRDIETDTITQTELALFLKSPIRNPPPNATVSFGIGSIKYDHVGNSFTPLDDSLAPVDPLLYLPNEKRPNVPHDFADIDGNGERDVILTAQSIPPSTTRIRIYWNGSQPVEGELSQNGGTDWDFPPHNSGLSPMDVGPIKGIAAINLDNDRYKELAVLTLDAVYLLKFNRPEVKEGEPDPFVLIPKEPLRLFDPDEPVFTKLVGGEAILVLDANSDGIDDLAVADAGKLLLYLGREQSQ